MPRVKRCVSVYLVLLGMVAVSCSSTGSWTRYPASEPLPEERTPPPRVYPSPKPTPPPSDPAIRQIQGVLQERGYDPGPLDGVLGKKTREALRRFQKDHHLAVTGEINADTKNTLLSPASSGVEAVEKEREY
jgi:peptidoglycan hydrolase-like protein with peptidoglycan-binding domain